MAGRTSWSRVAAGAAVVLTLSGCAGDGIHPRLTAVKTIGLSDQDTPIPNRAVDTGIHREGNAIYADTSDQKAIWVRRPDGTTERWARLRPHEGCAG